MAQLRKINSLFLTLRISIRCRNIQVNQANLPWKLNLGRSTTAFLFTHRGHRARVFVFKFFPAASNKEAFKIPGQQFSLIDRYIGYLGDGLWDI